MPYCKSIVKMKQLDLTKFFNCCSISSQDHIRQIPQYIKSTIVSQNIPFQISKNKDAPDTIICCGQHIPIHQKTTKLHLLGFCNWGAYSDIIRMIDINNCIHQIPFEFSDIYWGHSVSQAHMFNGEKQLRAMQLFIAENYEGFCHHSNVRLYHCSSNIEADVSIKNIILPDNEFIHIIAITVE